MRRVALLAVTLTAITLVLAGPAFGSLHKLVPAYFAPEGSPDPWQTMCEPADAGSVAILNPNNGPVKRQASLYLPAMSYCAERGWRTIGYVYTRYGRRSLKTVERAIAHYYLWYPTVQGIFLDEMAEAPSAGVDAYYGALEAYVHERGGLVVGNPGDTASSGWQLGYVDQVVTFEGSAADFAGYTPAHWVSEASPSQIANIVFAASGISAMREACQHAAAGGAGSVFVTDLSEKPNPYATLPSYWAGESEDC
jgi:hypothetical protein